MKTDRFHSTQMLAEIAFGDFDSIAEMNARIERDMRRQRWIRRKAKR